MEKDFFLDSVAASSAVARSENFVAFVVISSAAVELPQQKFEDPATIRLDNALTSKIVYMTFLLKI